MADSWKRDGETQIDYDQFKKTIHLKALRVPTSACGTLSRLLQGMLFNEPKLRHIVNDPIDTSKRLVLLAEKYNDTGIACLPTSILASLNPFQPLEVVDHDIELDYSYWSADYVLKKLLPSNLEIPSSFESIGHIAHLNLRDELLPYKKTIAQILLQKNSGCIRTVVNKVGSIENEYRVPTFEVLAGDAGDLITEVKQFKFKFKLDYARVYWNSRLEHEHRRLVSSFRHGQVVCDMFAGVGPFAIPAAVEKDCCVYANDLNPHSVQYLNLNLNSNGVSARVRAFNMDAREFMRTITRVQEKKEEVKGQNEQEQQRPDDDKDKDKDNDDKNMNADNLVHKDDDNNSNSIDDNGNGDGNGLIALNLNSNFSDKNDLDSEKDGEQNKHERVLTNEVKVKVGSNKARPDGEVSVKSKSKHKREKSNAKKKGVLNSKPSFDAKAWEHFDHVIMNLPASAIDFLDVFKGLLSRDHWKDELPFIHCYCFMRSNESMDDIIKHMECVLGGEIHSPNFITVRDVAPNKVMLCVSFRLPESVAFYEDLSTKDSSNPCFDLISSKGGPPSTNNSTLNDEHSMKKTRIN